MIRRFGEPVQNQNYRMRPGAYAILPAGQSILLTHQDEPVPEFQLPGGGIDPGESAIAALHREVLEETGWQISKPRRLGAFRRFTYMPEYDLWAEKLCHVYIARPTQCRGQPKEKGHLAVWTHKRDAPHLLVDDGCRAFLAGFTG